MSRGKSRVNTLRQKRRVVNPSQRKERATRMADLEWQVNQTEWLVDDQGRELLNVASADPLLKQFLPYGPLLWRMARVYRSELALRPDREDPRRQKLQEEWDNKVPFKHNKSEGIAGNWICMKKEDSWEIIYQHTVDGTFQNQVMAQINPDDFAADLTDTQKVALVQFITNTLEVWRRWHDLPYFHSQLRTGIIDHQYYLKDVSEPFGRLLDSQGDRLRMLYTPEDEEE